MSSSRRKPISVVRFVLLAALLLSAGCVVQTSQSKASAKRGVRSPVHPVKDGVATFDAAWRIIDESYYDTNFHGVDWAAVRQELRPKAADAQSLGQLRSVIGEMLGRLGQSHMALIPGSVADAFDPAKVRSTPPKQQRQGVKSPAGTETESSEPADDADDFGPGAQDGDVGMEVRLIDRRAVVNEIDPNGPAYAAGVKTGWIVQAVGDQRLAERLEKLPPDLEPPKAQFMAWRLAKALFLGRPGSMAQIDFLNEANQPVSLTLERQRSKGYLTKLGYLPSLYAHLDSRRIKSESGAEVGYIRFNFFMIPVAGLFDRAIEEFRGADGIVIDLRGNLGGLGGMVMGLAGHFLKDRISLGTVKMRGNEIKFYANPRWVNPAGDRVEPYSGPVAILVDGVSLSAAEIFAGGMQDIGRARLFGETSPGQALPAVWDRLPNGDVLYHAFADFVTPSGIRLEGRGVIPDEVIRITREELLEGGDSALLAALKWISEQPNSQAPGRRQTKVRNFGFRHTKENI